MDEEWKNIEGYEGLYQISNLGKVKSLKFGKEVILIGCKMKHGHKQIQLFKKGKSSVIVKLIHRLVAIYFIDNPLNLPCVCHKDETLDENGCLYNGEDNLFWGTHKDNMQDMKNKGRFAKHLFKNNHMKGIFGKDHNGSKKVYQFTKDGYLIREWDSAMDIQRELGINNSRISDVCRGRLKTSGGFKWSHTKITQ